MTKEEAYKYMLDYSRDVISPSVAANLISPWTTLKKLKVNPRPVKTFRIAYVTADAENPAYDASRLVLTLAESLGMPVYYSPYEGDGTRHQDEMEHAISFLKSLD